MAAMALIQLYSYRYRSINTLTVSRQAKDRGGVNSTNYAVGDIVKAKLCDSVFFRQRSLVEKFTRENSNFVVFGLYTNLAKVVPIIQQEIAVDYVMTFS